ncbi:hypothetical protein M0R45_005681 [Rubus argutus]|uniref:RING-type domain-containing protein n=1 Tax=Rubus argutus TaxID=59490 RepID=A0AAW1YNH1_RUBAR
MSKNAIVSYRRGAMGWKSVDKCTEIPPSDDALEIRFVFGKETKHVIGTREDVLEKFEIPQTEKAITIRPSELCNKDATSVKQSYSIRMIEDVINNQYPPSERERKRSLTVDRAIELVQNRDLPPNCVLCVIQLDGIMIVHDTSDKKRVLDYVEATRRGTCSICMDDFEVGRDASRLPCLHIFHGKCIFNWLHRNHNCPICRYPIPPEWITWF